MFLTSMFPIISSLLISFFFFFFNDTATTEIYTLSLHDALPISEDFDDRVGAARAWCTPGHPIWSRRGRSEEHTSELQSHSDLVCRLLLEKKKNKKKKIASKQTSSRKTNTTKKPTHKQKQTMHIH